MKRARDDLLAGPALAGDEHRTAVRSDPRDQLEDLDHAWTHADDVAEAIPISGRFLRRLPLADDPPTLQRPPNGEQQLVEPDGLAHIIVRAFLDRLQGRLDRSERGREDHTQVRVGLAQASEQAETVQVGHPDIRDDNVEDLFSRQCQCCAAVVRLAHLVPFCPQRLGHGRAGLDVVVHHEQARSHHATASAGAIGSRTSIAAPPPGASSTWIVPR